MATKAQRELAALAEQRTTLRAQLDELKPSLRDAAVEAVRNGAEASSVARLAGVSRETLYKWLRAQGIETNTLALERRLEARIAVLDKRWDKLVDSIVAARAPGGGLSRGGNYRSGYQLSAGQTNVRNLGRPQDTRVAVGIELDRLMETSTEPSVLRAKTERLEADELKRQLEALREARLGF